MLIKILRADVCKYRTEVVIIQILKNPRKKSVDNPIGTLLMKI